MVNAEIMCLYLTAPWREQLDLDIYFDKIALVIGTLFNLEEINLSEENQ